MAHDSIPEVALGPEAERLYLSYALSVITSRALPDVRDGLKPVQRRILYAMHNELHVGPDAKPKKCAAIVGDVMGKFHPHGDSSIYEALARMAQDWVLRAPLVYGHGNFGSIDGDPPAAMRYTEAKLQRVALELLSEIGKKTVAFRPNYDGTKSEPVVLPARLPNLLVNGAEGIAVGMATSIPPHNLGEVIDACVALIDDPEIAVKALQKKMKGPDFPTGGEILNSNAELLRLYETGQGSVRVRGEWKLEDDRRGPRAVITSIPYRVEKKTIVEKIADVIVAKKLPSLVDVRDESTDQIRIVLELKRDANPDLVMAFLYKQTPLQDNVPVNLTCLVPTDNPELATPKRLDLKQLLRQFLDFRFEVVTKRLEYDLHQLNERLHVLEGFEKVFDALDEIIKLIRKSEGKDDAAQQIMKRWKLDEVQTDAILELKLYRLARLEILIVQKEAKEKRAEAKRLQALLKSPSQRWSLIKTELEEIRTAYADKRRTRILTSSSAAGPEFSAEDFIVDEDAFVIVTQQGWLKRQGTVKDLGSTRIREGDAVLECLAGSMRASAAFFSTLGACYVARIADVPASTGYGDPIQKLFKLGDGEKLAGALGFDPRLLEVPDPAEDGTPEPPWAVAVTRGGQAFRFSLRAHKEPSTRAGRRFARLNEGDEVLTVFPAKGQAYVLAVADDGHAIAVNLEEVPILSGPGKGNMLIKLDAGARLLAAVGVATLDGSLVAYTEAGKRCEISARRAASARGGKGEVVVKKAGFVRVELPAPEVPVLEAQGAGGAS
jgi:DNA gyrase subunit A